MNKSKKNLIKGIITTLTIVSGAAFAGDDISMLYLQQAESGSVYKDSKKQGCYNLTMNKVDEYTLYVTEEPVRITGRLTMNEYMDLWNNHEEKNYPNAILHAREAEGGMRIVNDTAILSNMQYDSKNRILTYRLCPVKKQVVFAEGRIKDVRLFID